MDPFRPYVFMTPPTAGVVAEQLLRYFSATGLVRIAVAHDSTSMFSRTGLAKQEALAEGHGVEFVSRQVFSTGTTDFDALLAEVAGSGAQALMVWATGPGAAAEGVEGRYRYTPTDHAGLTVDDVAVTVVRDGTFTLTEWSRTRLESTLADAR